MDGSTGSAVWTASGGGWSLYGGDQRRTGLSAQKATSQPEEVEQQAQQDGDGGGLGGDVPIGPPGNLRFRKDEVGAQSQGPEKGQDRKDALAAAARASGPGFPEGGDHDAGVAKVSGDGGDAAGDGRESEDAVG